MDKSQFRRVAISRLRNIPTSRAKSLDHRVNIGLKKIIDSMNIESVMVYIPLGMEVDINPLIKYLRAKGVNLYVPFMEGKSFILVKYRLPLIKKRFGIYEPKISRQYRKRDIDLAIVPIVGTDKTLRRVGFGKGMYDRFFENSSRYINRVIFVQRLFCINSSIITQEHDVASDLLISSKGYIDKRFKYRLPLLYTKILNSI